MYAAVDAREVSLCSTMFLSAGVKTGMLQLHPSMLQSPVLFLHSGQGETTYVGDGARNSNRITGCLDFLLSPFLQMSG